MVASAARSLGLVLVLSTAIISGVSTFVNFWAVQGTNSDAFLAVRNSLVAVMLLPLAFLARWDRRARLTGHDWATLAIVGLVGGAVPFLLFFRGLQLAGAAGAATATFAYRTLFIMAAAMAAAFLRERLGWRWSLGALAILGGNVLLLSLTAPVWTDGTAWVLAATALWAAEYTISRATLGRLPSGLMGAGRMGFGSLFLLVYVMATGQAGTLASLDEVHWQWAVISAALLVAFVATWYEGLRHVDLPRATAILVLGFPITWALGLMVGRGTLGIPEVAGVAAVGMGVVVLVGVASLRDTLDDILARVSLTARGVGP